MPEAADIHSELAEILRFFGDPDLRISCVEAIRREKERLSWDRFCAGLTAFAEQL